MKKKGVIDTLNAYFKLKLKDKSDVKYMIHVINSDTSTPLEVNECKKTLLEILWPEKYIGKLRKCEASGVVDTAKVI